MNDLDLLHAVIHVSVLDAPRVALKCFLPLEIKFFQMLQVLLNRCDGSFPQGRILSEQALLTPRPNLQFGAVEIGFNRDHYGVGIESFLNYLGSGKYSLYSVTRGVEFLNPPVSVTTLAQHH